MSNVVWYRPLNGLGEIRIDLDAPGTLRHVIDDDDERLGFGRGPWERVTLAFYRLPNGTLIEHFWQPDWFVGNPQFDPDECSFHEVESLYVEQTLGWPLDPIEASVSDPGESTSNPSPPSKEKPPEADPVPVRVVNAAYALKTQGKRVSLRAVCEKAGVDRTNFVRNYPEAAEMVKKIAAPDRQPMRGSKRDGRMEACEDDD